MVAVLCFASAFAQHPAEHPGVAAWLKAGAECNGDLCRFTAIQNALKLEPANRDANLALARYYVSRDQRDQAREAAERVLSVDPADLQALKLVADLDLQDGRLATALAAYRRIEQEGPSNAAMQRDVASAYERLGLISDAARASGTALNLDPTDPSSQAMSLRLAERMRDAAGMRAVCERILRVQPHHAEAQARLAQLGATDRAAKRRASPIVAPQPAEPSSENARLRRAWLTGQFGDNDSDAAYLSDPAQTVASAREIVSGNLDATLLSDVRIDRVRPNGLAASRVQQFYYVSTQAGAAKFSTRSVQYSPTSESLTIVRARTHKRNGGFVEAVDEGDERVADASAAMYYDVRSRTVRFASVEPGDVIELDYRITPATDINEYGNYFASFQMFRTAVPERLKRYVVIASADRPLHFALQHMPEAQVSERGGERAYLWEARDLDALPNEPLGPAATEYAPYVHVSTIRDLQALGRWYSQLLEPQLALSPELKQVAAAIAREHKKDIDRVNAVYRFALTSTHYVALEFGIHSYKPYRVADVYARRFGDCKDKASLIIALLREMNIAAEFALVRTRPLGPIAENAASVALFNHAVAYVPSLDLWLDGTADYYSLRELPVVDQNALALTVAADGSSRLRTIPGSRPEQNTIERRVAARIQPDATIKFHGSSVTRGENAPALRRDFEVTERRRESVRRALADFFPTVKVDDVRVDEATAERQVDMWFDGVLDSYAGQRVVPLRTSWLQRDYLQRLALLSERSQDLVLGVPWTTQEEFWFDLPAGAKVETPTALDVATPFGKATITYVHRANMLTIRSRVQFTTTRVSAADYPKFRAFCVELERAFRRDVKVTLP